MIYDKITNINRYKGLDASLDFAIEYMKNTNFQKLIEEEANTKIEIAHDKLFVITNSYTTSEFEEKEVQMNGEFIEIHLPISGKEIIHFSNPEISEENLAGADYIGDITDTNDHHNDLSADKLTLGGGRFALIFPGERFQIECFEDDETAKVNKVTVLSRYED